MQELTTIQQQPAPAHHGKGKILLISIGVIGLGTAGYFAWQKFKPKPVDFPASPEDTEFPAALPAPQKSTPAVTSNTNFPLKRGSTGERVKAIQQVLVAKGLLDAKDVIGQFGPKTEAALIKAGFPVVISEASYAAITSGSAATPAASSSVPINVDTLATGLYNAALSKNFNAAIALLGQMKSTGDYSAVSEKFKTNLIGGVHQTLVNGMLSSFASIDQKAAIKKAFTDMGLKYDGSKFSLSGIGGRGIITTQPTTVYDQNNSPVNVPANMVLGTEAGKQGSYTQFKNNGKYFLVPTININYL